MNVGVSASDQASWEQHHIDGSMQLLRQGRVGEVGRGRGRGRCKANPKRWFTTSSWRKVPESDARSVGAGQTPSTGLRHPSFNHCRI